jgi:hypothetical protein
MKSALTAKVLESSDDNNDEYCYEIQSLQSGGEEDGNGSTSHGGESRHTTSHDGDIEHGYNDGGAKELRETVIKTEESHVNKSRILVGSAILLCAIAVTLTVYMISKRSEQHTFEAEVRRVQVYVWFPTPFGVGRIRLSVCTHINRAHTTPDFFCFYTFHASSNFFFPTHSLRGWLGTSRPSFVGKYDITLR